MSDPPDRFVNDRMSDATDLGQVDDAVNNLEAAIRYTFGLPANPEEDPEPAMQIALTGEVNFPRGLAIGGSNTVGTIVDTIPPDAGANDDNLPNVAAVRQFVYDNASDGSLTFAPNQRFGSLWVTSDQVAPTLGVGPPAYWQIVGRSNTGETVGVDLTVPTPSSYFDLLPIGWFYTLYEHPALDPNQGGDEDLRPCKTHLASPTYGQIDIVFPVEGLWHVECIVEAKNWDWDAALWNPPNWTNPFPNPTPCWTLQLWNDSTSNILWEHRSPQIITSRRTSGAHPNKIVLNSSVVVTQETPSIHISCPTSSGHTLITSASETYDEPANFMHTLLINRTIYVQDTDHRYQLRLQQMSGADNTVGKNAFRAVFRHIPTNGG